MRAELPDEGFEDREFDVFISHATEDKVGVVRPLAHAPTERGVNVWFDEFELRVGDSLRRKIDAGIARSRFGLVVLSPAFFAKNWPQYELDGLVARDMADGGRRLLPIWHEITKDELIRHSPSLVDRVALSTATLTVNEIGVPAVHVTRSISQLWFHGATRVPCHRPPGLRSQAHRLLATRFQTSRLCARTRRR